MIRTHHPRYHRLRGIVGRLVLILVLLVAVSVPTAALFGLHLLEADPEYWCEIDREDPVVAKKVELMEAKLDHELYQQRPETETWELGLHQDQLREWMAVRMPQWLQEHGVQESFPEWLEQPMAQFQEGKLVVAGEVTVKGVRRIVSAELMPVTGPDGNVELRLIGTRGGRLPIPQDLFDKLVEETGSVKAAEEYVVSKAREELKNVRLPTLTLRDGRRVEIVDIKLRPTLATLICRTLSTPGTQTRMTRTG
ncbi:MAG: hypothetical protein JSV78_14615 [Phycisphaerales bacterium]|nr:MAG: hypothetical protein JSV78_14615 [Phycisphaerales bacterium]